MRYFVLFSLLAAFLFCRPAFAEGYLRDVPEGHYAYDAVYDLIRRGVTGGFPDGTFRGKKLMNRYEIASFISKLARSFRTKQGADEKLLEELRSEVSLLEHAGKAGAKVSLDFEGLWRAAALGTRANYRLRTEIKSGFLKIGLDTMDAGFNGPSRDLLREMLDFEGEVQRGAVTLKATSGPGEVLHPDDRLFPMDNNLRYRRPWRTISASVGSGKTRVSAAFLSRSSDTSGRVGVSEICLKLSFLNLLLFPRYFFDSAGQRELRLEVEAGAYGFNVLAGMARGPDYPHGLFIRGELKVDGRFRLMAQKIGSQYRQKFTYTIFDLFDRGLEDGVFNLGAQLNTPIFNSWYVDLKGDFTNPGEVITMNYALGRRFSPAYAIELIYQTYQAQRALLVRANLKL